MFFCVTLNPKPRVGLLSPICVGGVSSGVLLLSFLNKLKLQPKPHKRQPFNPKPLNPISSTQGGFSVGVFWLSARAKLRTQDRFATLLQFLFVEGLRFRGSPRTQGGQILHPKVISSTDYVPQTDLGSG